LNTDTAQGHGFDDSRAMCGFTTKTLFATICYLRYANLILLNFRVLPEKLTFMSVTQNILHILLLQSLFLKIKAK